MRQLIKLCVTGISVVLLMLAFIPTNLLTFGDRLVCGSIGFLIFVICQPSAIFRLLMWLQGLVVLIASRIHNRIQTDSEDLEPCVAAPETALPEDLMVQADPKNTMPEDTNNMAPLASSTTTVQEEPVIQPKAKSTAAKEGHYTKPLNDVACLDKLNSGETEDMFSRIRDPNVMAHYIVLDIETTGLNKDTDRIIEIAAIHYVFGEEAERFHTYINPQIPIPKRITQLTGIRQSDVNAAPVIDDIANAFRKFIKGFPIVGHNVVNFDWPFMKARMMLVEPPLLIDTLDMARSAFPLLPSHKLPHLNYWFDLEDGVSHRADSDAAATNALMWACLHPEKYQSEYQAAIQYGIPKKEHAPKGKAPQKVSIAEIKPSEGGPAQLGPLLGKKIVFTGELSISRNAAMQLAVDAGAMLRTSVSSKTDFLVVGEQDLSVVGADGMSGKEEKAHALNASGKCHIKIINEAEFMELLTEVPNADTLGLIRKD